MKIIRKHQEDMAMSFDNPKYSDVKIWINNKIFEGHKLILSRNSHFEKMFTLTPDLNEIHLFNEISNLKRSNDESLPSNDFDEDKKGDIVQCSADACESFLRYLYSPTKLTDAKINLDLLLVAYKLNDETLKEFCENRLVKNVNSGNAIPSLLVSLKTECKNLKIKASIYIAKNFCEMKRYVDFQQVWENEEALLAILDVFGNFLTEENKINISIRTLILI